MEIKAKYKKEVRRMENVKERKNYGSFEKYLKTKEGGRIAVNVNFENTSKVTVSSMEELTDDFLEKVEKLIEKD